MTRCRREREVHPRWQPLDVVAPTWPFPEVPRWPSANSPGPRVSIQSPGGSIEQSRPRTHGPRRCAQRQEAPVRELPFHRPPRPAPGCRRRPNGLHELPVFGEDRHAMQNVVIGTDRLASNPCTTGCLESHEPRATPACPRGGITGKPLAEIRAEGRAPCRGVILKQGFHPRFLPRHDPVPSTYLAGDAEADVVAPNPGESPDTLRRAEIVGPAAPSTAAQHRVAVLRRMVGSTPAAGAGVVPAAVLDGTQPSSALLPRSATTQTSLSFGDSIRTPLRSLYPSWPKSAGNSAKLAKGTVPAYILRVAVSASVSVQLARRCPEEVGHDLPAARSRHRS